MKTVPASITGILQLAASTATGELFVNWEIIEYDSATLSCPPVKPGKVMAAAVLPGDCGIPSY